MSSRVSTSKAELGVSAATVLFVRHTFPVYDARTKLFMYWMHGYLRSKYFITASQDVVGIAQDMKVELSW
jgi:hypothetical protein